MAKKIEIAGSWTFNTDSVADNFDSHVREQLPWYSIVTRGLVTIAREYIPEGGTVYDIGASTGNIGTALLDVIRDRKVDFHAIEPSAHMADRYRGPGRLHRETAQDFEYEKFDCAIAMLTMMFVPVARRRDLIRKLEGSIRTGGAIVCVDKTYAPGGRAGGTFRRMAWDFKQEHGATGDEIVSKELSLTGIQVPICLDQWAEHFRVTQWFQMGEFGGWVFERMRDADG